MYSLKWASESENFQDITEIELLPSSKPEERSRNSTNRKLTGHKNVIFVTSGVFHPQNVFKIAILLLLNYVLSIVSLWKWNNFKTTQTLNSYHLPNMKPDLGIRINEKSMDTIR